MNKTHNNALTKAMTTYKSSLRSGFEFDVGTAFSRISEREILDLEKISKQDILENQEFNAIFDHLKNEFIKDLIKIIQEDCKQIRKENANHKRYLKMQQKLKIENQKVQQKLRKANLTVKDLKLLSLLY